MATPPYNILSEIIGRVEELSNAVAPLNQRTNTSGSSVSRLPAGAITSNQAQTSMSTVEEEVSRAFNRPSSRSQNSGSATPPAKSQKYGPLFGLRRNFQGRSGGSKPKKPKQPSGPFLRDVVLLTGPEDRIVPRQGVRVWLSEHGHILSGFEFYKEWNECQVELAIKEAFEDKILAHTDFEILMSIHSALVAPTLAPGQKGLSGVMIHRIFKGKPVYVRPLAEIVNPNRLPWSSQNDKKTKQDFDDHRENDTDFQPLFSSWGQPADALDVHQTNSPEVQQTNSPEVQQTSLPEVQQSNLPEVQQSNLPEVQQSNLPEVQQSNLCEDHQSNSSQAQQTNSAQDHSGFDQYSSVSELSSQVQPSNSSETVQNILELDDDILEHRQITVNREQIRDKVVEIFQDPHILKCFLHVTIIGNDGKAEKGSGRGVMLDMLTNFWQHVFDSLTVGTQEKVPSIRHDYQKAHWQAIARVLVYGYAREKYFPIHLSTAFIAAALFGEESLSDDFLFQSFQLYVSSEERDILVVALSGNVSPNDEDVLDVLGNYKCYRYVTTDNIAQTVNELAHQELLQKPRYIIDCFSSIIAALKVFSPFDSVSCLKEMYDIKKPTPRKIVKLLTASPSTEAEHTCLDHLKRYIRTLEGSGVNQFLAFVTGSDVIACESIDVTFLELVGTARRPIAHTCGPVLEIPSTYQTYNELAEEFNFIIKNPIAWGFTIV